MAQESPPEDPKWAHLKYNETRASKYPVIMEQKRAKDTQEDPKIAQVSAKMAQSEAQDGPRKPPREPQMDPLGMQRNSFEQVSGHNGDRVPKKAQEDPRMARVSPKMTRREPLDCYGFLWLPLHCFGFQLFFIDFY